MTVSAARGVNRYSPRRRSLHHIARQATGAVCVVRNTWSTTGCAQVRERRCTGHPNRARCTNPSHPRPLLHAATVRRSATWRRVTTRNVSVSYGVIGPSINARPRTPKWKEGRRKGWRRRRALIRGAVTESYTTAWVAERDKWRCGLCGKKVNPTLKTPHPMSLSIDHVVPLALGGDDVKANVQLAHRRCNVRKHTRAMNEQLRLLG